MASKMVGRATCPECGFQSAHVKQSEKCLYRYCPECGSQHYARSEKQRADLLAKTRTETVAGAPTGAPATATGSGSGGTGSGPTDTPQPPPASTPPGWVPIAELPKKRRGLFV